MVKLGFSGRALQLSARLVSSTRTFGEITDGVVLWARSRNARVRAAAGLGGVARATAAGARGRLKRSIRFRIFVEANK